MPGTKNLCVHPIRHRNDRRIGRRPSHPQGDRLCKLCYCRERARYDELYPSQCEPMKINDDGEEEAEEEQESIDITPDQIDDEIEEESEEEEDDDESDDSSYSTKEEHQINKETLDSIFALLGSAKIIDV